MKIKFLLLTVLLAVLCVGLAPRQASASVTFSYFYDSLQPYGDWVDVETYGYCWQPRGVDPDWRPYTDGYWTYTDAGWTWVSYEEFGSITYHYGRWIRLEDFGWVWKPDYQWGPAWVSWRQSDDYIGWAPLPPEVDFNPDSGIGVWVDRDYDIGPSAYSFCEYRYFGAPVVRNFILPWRRNVILINSTVNITNIAIIIGEDNRRIVFNGGLDYRRVSERTEHRIGMLRLMRQTNGDWARHPRPELSRQIGSQLFINAPEIEAPHKRFAPPKVAREIRAPKIDKGWKGISENRDVERIKARYQDQTRGLTRATAPAKAVDAQTVQTLLNENRARQEQKPAGPQEQVQPQRETDGRTARRQQPQVQQPQVQQPQAQQPRVQQPQAQQPQVQQPQVQQPQVQQPQAVEQQQRRASESNARAAREQQKQAQREQQVQQQQAVEQQQRRAAESNARAAREQQQQAQREQQAQQQQRRAAESNARAARAPQAPQAPQPSAERRERPSKEAQSSPTPDDNDPRKRRRD